MATCCLSIPIMSGILTQGIEMIEFSNHAKEQYKKRKIPKRQIVRTVENPEKLFKSFRRRTVRQRRFGEKILEVVTIIENEKIVVITQYYLGGAYEN